MEPDRVLFMWDGVIVEEGLAHHVIDNPEEEATRTFVSHSHPSTEQMSCP